MLTRYDVGPIAIEFFLKISSLFFLMMVSKTKDKRWLWLCVVAVALGIFNKSNFVWWTNSLYAMFFLYLLLRKKMTRRLFLIFIAIPLALMSYLFLNFRGGPINITTEITLAQLQNKIPLVFFQSKNLLSGRMFYDYVGIAISPRFSF